MIWVLFVISFTIGDVKIDGDNIHLSVDGMVTNQTLEGSLFKDIHLHIHGKRRSFDSVFKKLGKPPKKLRKGCTLKKECGGKRKCKATYLCSFCSCGKKPKGLVGFLDQNIGTYTS